MKIYEDSNYLTSEDEINNFFSEAAYDELDCGQGYCTNKGEAFAKIGDKYYLVKFEAEIGSAKQDRGDRLYWVERIASVTWKPIKEREVFSVINKEILEKIADYKYKIIELKKKLCK